MPYVLRDSSGKIKGIFAEATADALEELGADDADLVRFLAEVGLASPGTIRQLLAESDMRMVRLVDDLIDVLLEKTLIRITDLPPAASQKYLQRQAARKRLQGIQNLVVDEKDIL
ncbi:MAG: tryptophan synthase subunit beta [Betaproteobacteria bacterium]|nr:tryptophan synthase subunit beta [Betaproteobacteria bacterium]